MKIAIHKTHWSSFAGDWILYCETQGIPFKIVDCFSNGIIHEVEDCDIILWHHHHTLVKDKLIAQRILYALEQSGKKVFPDWRTGWHFDDKLGQKYLLEAVGAPTPETFAFFEEKDALRWVESTIFPKVFKLRGGAGSLNVKLVETKAEAVQLVRQAFRQGFPTYNKWEDFKENFRKWKLGKAQVTDVLKSIRRYWVGTAFSRTFPYERGYVYFQDFMPGNDHDIRIITVGDKAIGIKRQVRKNDFRASGSGFIIYNPEEIDIECVRIAFQVSKKLGASVVAYDFVYNKDKSPVIVEINYGFAQRAYDACPGFWDEKLDFHPAKVNVCDWIIDYLQK